MSEAREAVGERGRWSSRRKAEVVLRHLRGEGLDAASGRAGLKSRPADERDDELGRLRAKVGELTMEHELLRERAQRAEGDAPFGRRRSR